MERGAYRGDGLAQEEGGRARDGVALEAVEVVAAVVGGDDEKAPRVGEDFAQDQVDQRRAAGGVAEEHGGEDGDANEARDEEGAEHVHEELGVGEELVVPARVAVIERGEGLGLQRVMHACGRL